MISPRVDGMVGFDPYNSADRADGPPFMRARPFENTAEFLARCYSRQELCDAIHEQLLRAMLRKISPEEWAKIIAFDRKPQKN